MAEQWLKPLQLLLFFREPSRETSLRRLILLMCAIMRYAKWGWGEGVWGGLRQLHSLDSKAVAEKIIVDQHDWAWAAGLWPLTTGTG